MTFTHQPKFVALFSIVSLVAVGGCKTTDNQTTPKPTAVMVVPTPTPNPYISGKTWSDHITEVNGKTVSLNLGDRAGGLGDDDDSRLALDLLDYSLNSHPGASIFVLYYSYTVAMGTDEFELVYNRKKQTFGVKSGGRGKPVTYKKPPIKGVDDEAIHSAAIGYGSYHDVKGSKKRKSSRK